MEEYESGVDKELHFSIKQCIDIAAAVDNIVRETEFHVELDTQIRFIVGQSHNTIYTLT